MVDTKGREIKVGDKVRALVGGGAFIGPVRAIKDGEIIVQIGSKCSMLRCLPQECEVLPDGL
jgi:hypothetical protein